MAEKRPLALYDGEIRELASGDTLPGGAAPAGSPGALQYNNSGVFGGSSLLWEEDYSPPAGDDRDRLWFPDDTSIDFGSGKSGGQMGAGGRIYSEGDDLFFQSDLVGGLFGHGRIALQQFNIFGPGTEMPILNYATAGLGIGGIGPYMYVQDFDGGVGTSAILLTNPSFPSDARYTIWQFGSEYDYSSIEGTDSGIVVSCDSPYPLQMGRSSEPSYFDGFDFFDIDVRMQKTRKLCFGGEGMDDYLGYAHISNESTTRFDFKNAADEVVMSLDFDDRRFSVFNATPAGQQTFGAATAGGSYGATEQTMLQKCYDALRTFGFGT